MRHGIYLARKIREVENHFWKMYYIDCKRLKATGIHIHKTQSDSTTPQLSRFTVGLILNEKLSTLEPLRAKQTSFIHDIGADGGYE